MAVTFSNVSILLCSDGLILQSSAGDILLCSRDDLLEEREGLNLDFIKFILEQPIILPKIRLSVLNADETLNYVIPNEHIVLNGINYNENHTNGQRRTLSIKLINIKDFQQFTQMIDGKIQTSSKEYYKYAPNVNGLWYGTKIKYEVGLEYQEQDYY